MFNAKESWIQKERPMYLILRSSDPQIRYSSHDFKLLPSFASSWAFQSPSLTAQSPIEAPSSASCLPEIEERPLSTTERVDQGVPPALLEFP